MTPSGSPGGSGDSRTPVYPPPAAAWRAVVVLLVVYILSLLDRNILTLLIGPIQAHLKLTDFQISLVMGLAFGLSYSLMSLPIGWMIDRYPRRLVIFVCIVIWSLGTTVSGFATGFLWLFIARVMIGGGEAAVLPGAQSILADTFPRQRLALPMSIFGLGGKGGQALSLLIGGAIASIIVPTATFVLPGGVVLQGWQLIFVCIGLPGVLIALLVFAMPEPPRHAPASTAAADRGYRGYGKFFRVNYTFVIALIVGLMCALSISTAITGWTPAYLQRNFGWSAGQTGGALGTALLVGPLLGIPLHGYIADRLFQKGVTDIHLRYMAIVAVLGLPFALGAFLVDTAWLCVTLLGIFYFITCCFAALSFTALQVAIPSNIRGSGAAIQQLIAGFGGPTIGPLMVGAFTDFGFKDPNKVGLSLAITVTILLLTIALAFFFGMRAMRKVIANYDNPVVTGAA